METLDRSVAQLAHLLHQRNALDLQIARLIHRPAYAECLGKFIASQVFAVRLLRSTAHPDIDGHFLRGPLTGHSLKVQWYSRQDGTLDLIPNASVNEYLVFTGPPILPRAFPDLTPAWVIEQVYLFDAAALTAQLRSLGVSIGPYTHLPQAVWEAAEIYPRACSPRLVLAETQIELLRLFGAGQAVQVEAAAATAPVTAGQPGTPARPATALDGAPQVEIPAVEESGSTAPGPAPGLPTPEAVAGALPPEEDLPTPPPAPGPAETHPIAMRRWLTPHPATARPPHPPGAAQAPGLPSLPADLLVDLLADSGAEKSDTPDIAALEPAVFSPGDSAPAPAVYDQRSAADLPATAKLPPLPPGAHFPRPAALLPHAGTAGALPDDAASGSTASPGAAPGADFAASASQLEPPPAGIPRPPAPVRSSGGLPKKYQPLDNYLRAIPPDLDSLTLTFAQIEEIIADRLPASARKYPAWWSNELDGRHTQAHSWLDGGWWVEDIDLEQGRVRLRRRSGRFA